MQESHRHLKLEQHVPRQSMDRGRNNTQGQLEKYSELNQDKNTTDQTLGAVDAMSEGIRGGKQLY